MTALEHRVGKIQSRDLAALIGYRGRNDWWLRPDASDVYWLKVPPADEEEFRKLPLLGRWTAHNSGKLVREGKSVPEALLPEDEWQTLAAILPIATPGRGTLGMPPPAVGFSLEPDDAGHSATALICRGEDFSAWVSTALATRLDCLRFACCEDGRVFVAGNPLPPLPGAGYLHIRRLWIACGWRLPDHVWPELLEEVMGLGRNRICILHPDGRHEELDEENLIPVSRAAVRSTISA